MNEEALKETLLDIIEEARNLDENELEIIPGTDIKVKIGRVDEFKAYARFYYQIVNHIPTVGNEDYLNIVFDSLEEEITQDRKMAQEEKKEALYTANKEEIDRFNALQNSLNTNRQDQDRYRKLLEELSKKDITDTRIWQEITNLQNTLSTLRENENILKNAMIEIKNKVNSEVKKVVEEEMATLRNAYLNAKRGTATGFGLDGASILAKDKEAYDNLYILLKIIENVNEKDPIICINNTLCVNPHQEDAVKELLPKIDLLHMASKNKVEVNNEKPNDKLIKDISKELDRLKELMAKENKPTLEVEYNKLIQVLNYLNRANDQEFALTPIWDIAYVNGPDREAFINLIKTTSYFHGYDPDVKLMEENEKLIKELKDYLTSLEDKVRNYQGINNIPLTKVNDAIILPEDKEEYENILAIISILESSKDNLYKISEGGNVSYQDLAKYKELISKTKYFAPKVSEEEKIANQNGEVEKKIEAELTELIKRAKNTPNAILAEGKEILASDLEEYNLLSEQYKMLKSVNPNEPLVEVNGALINAGKESEYRKLLENLNEIQIKRSLNKAPTETEENNKDNTVIPLADENKVEEASTVIIPPVSSPSNNVELQTLTENELKKLEENRKEREPYPTEEESYDFGVINKALDKVEEVGKKIGEKLGKRKAVKSIRKSKKKEWWQKHKKQVILIGLLLIIVSMNLSTLVPAMIYANSCLAQAAPLLSGITGAINHSLASFVGGIGAINYNIAAGYTLEAMLVALGKIGVIGLSSFAVMKTLLSKKLEGVPDRLPDPFKKDLIDKIKEFGHNLVHDRTRAKEQVNTAGNTLKEVGMNAVYNVDSNNINLNKELMNEKIAYDANYTESYPELPASLSDNDLAEAQERIDKRARHMASELSSNSLEEPAPRHMEETPDIASTINNNLDKALSSSPKHMKEETSLEFVNRVNNDLQKATEQIDTEARHMREEPVVESQPRPEELDIENLPSNVIKLPAEIPDDWDMYLLENVEQGRGRS